MHRGSWRWKTSASHDTLYTETDYGIIRLVNKNENVTNNTDYIERRPSIIIMRGVTRAFVKTLYGASFSVIGLQYCCAWWFKALCNSIVNPL